LVFGKDRYKDVIGELERLGEETVKYKLAEGSLFLDRSVAEVWLNEKESSRREAREAAALAAAELAAKAAHNQATMAMWSAVVAVVAAIVSAREWLLEAWRYVTGT